MAATVWRSPFPWQIFPKRWQADAGWLWIHLSLADVRCRSWIAEHAPLSETARDTLLDADEHVRLDLLGNEIVGILPDFHQEFLQESDDLVRLHIVMTDRLLVTARRKPVHSIEVMRRAMDSGTALPVSCVFF